MRNNESYMTGTRPMKDPTPQQNIDVSQWMDPASIPPGTSVVEALKQLHDHLMQDSLNIKKWLEDVAWLWTKPDHNDKVFPYDDLSESTIHVVQYILCRDRLGSNDHMYLRYGSSFVITTAKWDKRQNCYSNVKKMLQEFCYLIQKLRKTNMIVVISLSSPLEMPYKILQDFLLDHMIS